MTSDNQLHQSDPKPLPREIVGPFLLLGVDKDVTAETIEAHWAQRIIWARKGQLNVSLSDVNWAREVLNDFEQRVRADVSSLNSDTLTQGLGQLAERYGVAEACGPTWEPLDLERRPAEEAPDVEVPDAESVRRMTVLPEIPWEAPAIAQILDRLVGELPDPWNLSSAEDQPG